MRIFVSACLLGMPCRYDGGSKPCKAVAALFQKHELVPFCPEIYGGLPTPRTPAERVDSRVITRDGRDVTSQYESGAEAALTIYRLTKCDLAVLKARSPSCGCDVIYDGSFTGALKQGAGVTAALFQAHGIRILDEDHASELMNP